MKVTVTNKTGKPLNISKLAPLMPTQTLGVNQSVRASVRDVVSLIKRASILGITVKQNGDFLELTTSSNKVVSKVAETTNSEKVEKPVVEPVKVETVQEPVIVEEPKVEDTKTEEVQETKPKRGRKPKAEAKVKDTEAKSKKKTASKSAGKKKLFGNNK